AEPHGFISSQKYGREVFASIHPKAPLVIAEAVWQYSHHVLIGLLRHQGPILLVANWSGQWPGLVGVLNLRGSLTKAGVDYSILWSEDFTSATTRKQLKQWLTSGTITHDTSHAVKLDDGALTKGVRKAAKALADTLRHRPAIMGVFDEGCMGMYNAIIPDEILHPCAVFKERLSQSALYHAMTQVPDAEAQAALEWLLARGMKFEFGESEQSHLTQAQVLLQLKMYIAALRIADEFGCDAIGIQYQQGLKDLTPASDLAEGLLNCSERPPVKATSGPNSGKVICPGKPLTHFNEVDECAGLDAILTQRVWDSLRLTPDNTLHDLRWGDWDQSGSTAEYVWVLEISGAAPPSHFIGGYAGTTSQRQPPMYFRLGGGTVKGISKPGEVVWSRIFVDRDKDAHPRLSMDIGRLRVVELPEKETQRRWTSTTPQWPIMHAVLYGVTRDQMMARHQSNHIQVVYAPDAKTADRALAIKAAMAADLGIRVNLCGENAKGKPLAEVVTKVDA
ncbi:MAG: fucose isomerase, partial [Planctomycetota bacterium]